MNKGTVEDGAIVTAEEHAIIPLYDESGVLSHPANLVLEVEDGLYVDSSTGETIDNGRRRVAKESLALASGVLVPRLSELAEGSLPTSSGGVP